MTKLTALAAIAVLAQACSPTIQPKTHANATLSGDLLSSGHIALAVDPHPDRNAQDPLRQDVGRQFIVEHYEAEVEPVVLQAIAQHRPAGFFFWNGNKVSGPALREVIRAYATKAATTGDQKGLLYATDYEGGGEEFTPQGVNAMGIQRFRGGMTPLVHPPWLGESLTQFGTELCSLQGEIMSKELTSIGINYPFTMSSDLSNRLFLLRSVSTDPQKVAACADAMMRAFMQNGHIVYVTKHFPGLGQTSSDTHLGTVVSHATTMDEENRHLAPFEALVNDSKTQQDEAQLSILASHAKVPLLDPDHITTESSKILKGVMREQLGFNGLIVSDAMWMGDYAKLSAAQMMPIYINSFLSGMDILLIKDAHFGAAVEFFRQVYDDEVSPDQMQACSQRTGLPWTELREKFLARMKESSSRLDNVLTKIGDVREQMGTGNPADETTQLRSRYDQILEALDSRWHAILVKVN